MWLSLCFLQFTNMWTGQMFEIETQHAICNSIYLLCNHVAPRLENVWKQGVSWVQSDDHESYLKSKRSNLPVSTSKCLFDRRNFWVQTLRPVKEVTTHLNSHFIIVVVLCQLQLQLLYLYTLLLNLCLLCCFPLIVLSATMNSNPINVTHTFDQLPMMLVLLNL